MNKNTDTVNLKEAFDKITPSEEKKEELLSKIKAEAAKRSTEKEKRSFFTAFNRFIPYAAAACVLVLIVGLGVKSGMFTDMMSTGAIEEASESYTAEAAFISDDTIAEDDCEYIEEASEETATETEGYSYFSDDAQQGYIAVYDGKSQVFSLHLYESDYYDPLTIWNCLCDYSEVIRKTNLLSYKEDLKSLTLNFDEGINEITSADTQYLISIYDTYHSFYPDYEFYITVNGDALTIDGEIFDFNNLPQ